MTTYNDVYHDSQANLNDILEALIDKESLGEILGRITAVCADKAEHIRSNYGDKGLAADWDKAAEAIVTLAEKLPI